MPEVVIEDVPVTREDRRERTGMVRALFAMQVGQSAVFDTSYRTAHVIISKARRRKIAKKLTGRFLVAEVSGGVRVGRVE